MEHNVYTRISKLCEQNKITVSQLEKALGFGGSSINKWPQKIPSAEKIKTVADYFHVSMDYLYGRSQAKSTADELMDEDVKSFLLARQNMSKEEWARAMIILHAAFPESFKNK